MDMSHVKKQAIRFPVLESRPIEIGQSESIGPGAQKAVAGSLCFLKRSQRGWAVTLSLKLWCGHSLTVQTENTPSL